MEVFMHVSALVPELVSVKHHNRVEVRMAQLEWQYRHLKELPLGLLPITICSLATYRTRASDWRWNRSILTSYAWWWSIKSVVPSCLGSRTCWVYLIPIKAFCNHFIVKDSHTSGRNIHALRRWFFILKITVLHIIDVNKLYVSIWIKNRSWTRHLIIRLSALFHTGAEATLWCIQHTIFMPLLYYGI